MHRGCESTKTVVPQQFIVDSRKRIEMFYLLSYSPEMNSSEYFNDDLKGVMQCGMGNVTKTSMHSL